MTKPFTHPVPNPISKPIEVVTPEIANSIRYVLCDIDDTLTTGGKLTAEAYCALWDLHNAGITVIPVTGRPAGWCDMIIREWPVSGVVGENGAFAFYMSDGHVQTLLHPETVSDSQVRLEKVRDRVLSEVKGSRVARDQFSRIYDLAIDFREDPPYLSYDDAKRIRDICVSMGAEAKISSIHVNTWFGKYDKLSMSLRLLRDVFGEADPESTSIFFGDSPNDEPMFAHFPLTCAVANILPFMDEITYPPTYLTSAEGGAGFTEAVRLLLSKRG
jgi:HAD superfamily hydrolase (TIGR01484 family)